MAKIANAPNNLSFTPDETRKVRLIFKNSSKLEWSKQTQIHVYNDEKNIAENKNITIKTENLADEIIQVDFDLSLKKSAEIGIHPIELSL